MRAQDDPGRLLAGGAAVVLSAAAGVSADGLSAGRALPVRSLAAARADRGRPRRAASGLGRRRVSGLFARRERGVGVLDTDPGSALGRREVSVLAGWVAGHVGLDR